MEIEAFLARHGFGDATQIPMAGDASSRRYVRLKTGKNSAILMIDPADDTNRFDAMSRHLINIGLSAPKTLAHEPGLMVLEDFGDAQFASLIAHSPDAELDLYAAAIDVLTHIEATQPPSGLDKVAPDTLAEMIEPAFTHYAPLFCSKPNGEDITNCLRDLLTSNIPDSNVLVLRDFHAENLIWLPERDGVKRVGLLDYQDALIGPPIYDLVSLLQDARRDVSPACHDAALRKYLDSTGKAETETVNAFHVLGLQRNLRILGIFARLAADSGKPSYLNLIPRVWSHIQIGLNAPVASTLKPLVNRALPKPTRDRIDRARQQCQTP